MRRINILPGKNVATGSQNAIKLLAVAALILICQLSFGQDRFDIIGKYVEVNGMNMYFEEYGNGNPIIVLHGAYMAIPSMGEIIPLLAENRKVFAVEFQGHGRTNDIDRPLTYEYLADDISVLMDSIGLEKADIFGYSMGAGVGLQVAIRHPNKLNKLIVASAAFDFEGFHQDFKDFVPEMTVEMFMNLPFAKEYRKLSPNPDGFAVLIEKLIMMEKQPLSWKNEIKDTGHPMLIIAGDADVVTPEHTVSLFRLLGGGVMGDMGKPLPASRLAILPATSHTALINQADLLLSFIDAFLKEEKPKGFFGE